jgi:hypothetical protein
MTRQAAWCLFVMFLLAVGLTAAFPLAAEEPKRPPVKNGEGGGDNPALAQFQARFAALDRNKDGVLDQDELAQLGREQAASALQKADANKDGKITKDEYTAWARKFIQDQQRKPQGDRPAPKAGGDRPRG